MRVTLTFMQNLFLQVLKLVYLVSCLVSHVYNDYTLTKQNLKLKKNIFIGLFCFLGPPGPPKKIGPGGSNQAGAL